MTTPIPTTTAYTETSQGYESTQNYTEPTPNYAADYAANQPPVSGNIGTPITDAGRPDVEGTSASTPLPPPPYGTVPPPGSVVPPTTPAGWDDPSRNTGGVG